MGGCLRLLTILDALAGLVCLLLAAAVAVRTCFPFNLVTGGFFLLLGAHWLHMARTLSPRTASGFYDHLFFYGALCLLLFPFQHAGWLGLLVFLPVLWHHPSVRAHFRLPPLGSAELFATPGVLFVGCLLAAAVLTLLGSDAPLAPMRNPGISVLYLDATTKVLWAHAVMTSIGGVLLGARPMYWAIPPVLFLSLLPEAQQTWLPMTLGLGLWLLPSTARFFGRRGNGLGAWLWSGGLWVLFVGVGLGLVPVGACRIHGLPLKMRPPYEAPHRGIVAKATPQLFGFFPWAGRLRPRIACDRCYQMLRLRRPANECLQQRLEIAAELPDPWPDHRHDAIELTIDQNGLRAASGGVSQPLAASAALLLRDLRCKLPPPAASLTASTFLLHWDTAAATWKIQCRRCTEYGF